MRRLQKDYESKPGESKSLGFTELETPETDTSGIDALLETQAVEASDAVEDTLSRLQSGKLKEKRKKVSSPCGCF
jgi:hypothetical protein